MPAFRAKKANATPEPEPASPILQKGASKKDRATPTRREAEAARRARLNPQLTKKESKARERQLRAVERQRTYQAFDSSPERQLVRDVVDSRLNLGEVALPLLLIMMAFTFVPVVYRFADIVVYVMWAFLVAMLIDTFFMWRRYKRIAAERIPDRPTKGMLFYGFNRQLSFRRWRTPPPRVKRGEVI